MNPTGESEQGPHSPQICVHFKALEEVFVCGSHAVSH